MVIISGGETSPLSVEAVYLAEAGWRPLTSCDLPALPQPRWAHTQDGPLLSRRHEHTSWRTEAGTLLLGGEASYKSSELVSGSDEVRPGFELNEARR